MNPHDLSEPLGFHVAPAAGQRFHLFCEISQQHLMYCLGNKLSANVYKPRCDSLAMA